jgi:hypothetical protein
MFSLDNFVSTEKSHLPTGFNPRDGLKTLFPQGYAGSIGELQNYVFRMTNTSAFPSKTAQAIFAADGAGRWLLAGTAQFASSDGSADDVQISVTFKYPNTTRGCFIEIDSFNVDNSGSAWAWMTGVDPWIRDNWPDIFAGNCEFYNNIALPLQGQGWQRTWGGGDVLGEGILSGFGPGNVTGGLPVSAGSDYWYFPQGGGHYESGTHDPWGARFDYAPLQMGQTSGPGTGVIVGTGPDPSSQMGNLGEGSVGLALGYRTVYAVFLNNTKDTVMTLQKGSLTSLPSPIFPLTAVGWSSTGGTDFLDIAEGTQGSAQYYPSKLGTCPVPSQGDTAAVNFNWNNPYAGSNSYSFNAPPQYLVDYVGGDGDTAVVLFSMSDAF